mmetsp:Transcript_41845/g.47685  ORF Transcript_41845/g.47685 Transcript_41845/m.47685 type:complete len:258 (+) Transcript_41845:4923-5696(+)
MKRNVPGKKSFRSIFLPDFVITIGTKVFYKLYRFKLLAEVSFLFSNFLSQEFFATFFAGKISFLAFKFKCFFLLWRLHVVTIILSKEIIIVRYVIFRIDIDIDIGIGTTPTFSITILSEQVVVLIFVTSFVLRDEIEIIRTKNLGCFIHLSLADATFTVFSAILGSITSNNIMLITNIIIDEIIHSMFIVALDVASNFSFRCRRYNIFVILSIRVAEESFPQIFFSSCDYLPFFPFLSFPVHSFLLYIDTLGLSNKI